MRTWGFSPVAADGSGGVHCENDPATHAPARQTQRSPVARSKERRHALAGSACPRSNLSSAHSPTAPQPPAHSQHGGGADGGGGDGDGGGGGDGGAGGGSGIRRGSAVSWAQNSAHHSGIGWPWWTWLVR